MNNYRIGRRQEYRTMRLLEAAGYETLRSAGSHGPWDVVGFNSVGIVVVQVKNSRLPSPEELEHLRSFAVPQNCRKLIHIWRPRKALPDVKEL